MVCHVHVHVHAEVANPAIPLHHNPIFRLRHVLCHRHFEVLHVVTPADKDDASKGYKICEICGSIARNVTVVAEVQTNEQWNEANNNASMVPPPTVPAPQAETRHLWQSQRFLNFILSCLVLAFVVSWLFHFNMPS